MLIFGLCFLIVNIILRGYLLPAEYHRNEGGDPSDGARFFFNPRNVWLYMFAEKTLRLGGTALIVASLFDFSSEWSSLILGGIVFGLIAFLVAPGLAMILAMKIHPYFRQTLRDRNP